MIRRLRSEQGLALTVAIFTLAVIALFSALVASTAGNLSGTSNESRDAKKAVAVANTGVATALDRLNRITSPLNNLGCLTNIHVATTTQATPHPRLSPGANGSVTAKAGNCPGASGRAGNDGEWTYFITLLNNNQHCDDQYTTQTQVNNLLAAGAGGISVLRRCIVSYGVVNGVQRRVQQEIWSDFRLFHGLIGKQLVNVTGGADLGASHVGSNGHVGMESGTLFNGQVELREGATQSIDATGVWHVTERPEPWIADPVRVGAGNPADSATITCVTPPAPLCDMWNESARELKVDPLETVSISGDDYRLCGLHLNGGTIEVVGTVNLWIDECRDGSGNLVGTGLKLEGGGLLNTLGGTLPESLRIFVEGNRPVQIGGSLATTANFALYAPESVVTVGGGSGAPIVKGSITADTIHLQGAAKFVGDPLLDITAPFAQIAGKWHPGKWSECRKYPTDPNDELSGCND